MIAKIYLTFGLSVAALLTSAQAEATLVTVTAEATTSAAERAQYCKGAPTNAPCQKFAIYLDNAMVWPAAIAATNTTATNKAKVVRQFRTPIAVEKLEDYLFCELDDVWAGEASFAIANRFIDPIAYYMPMAELISLFGGGRAVSKWLWSRGPFGIIVSGEAHGSCLALLQ